MYYNLDQFGKDVTTIRKNLNYTQQIVSDLTTLSMDTLRKIENGKVTPNHITLELLSHVLKIDLNQLLLNYRFENYIFINDLVTRIDLKLESGDFNNLIEELPNLEDAISKNSSQYANNMLRQFYLFTESVIYKIQDKDYNLCLSKLIESVKLTTPNFHLDNFDEFIYSNFEIRLLMNIGLVKNILISEKKGLDILKFCLSQLDEEQILMRIKIIYNLANTCYKLDLHDESLRYSNMGIDTCITNQSLSCLELLYYRKAIAEYYMNDNNHINTLKRTITLYDISGKGKLKEMLIDSCNRIHKIDINKILN